MFLKMILEFSITYGTNIFKQIKHRQTEPFFFFTIMPITNIKSRFVTLYYSILNAIFSYFFIYVSVM